MLRRYTPGILVRSALLFMVSHHTKAAQDSTLTIPRDEQPDLRNLGTMAAAHNRFLTEGNGDPAVVKEYFNVLSQPFFNIPLNQVCWMYLVR